ncbi:MAG TPA: sigma 54-interacting transcriptional regulator [Thermoanaerobaculia bacterium]|nr:sigma 54-interacting transcriptional regulator [Thermoanaerobaculia bacterium]
MLRLVAYAPDGVRRFPILRPELVIGSRPDCDIVLPYSGVARKHARVLFDGEVLRVEDLGSRRGLLVDGRRVKQAELRVLDEVKVGGVTLLVEDVVPEPEAPPPAPPAAPDTDPPAITPALMVEHLAAISHWVLSDAESRATLESLVERLLADFGGGVLFLFLGDLEGDLEDPGIKFVTGTDRGWLAAGEDLLEQVRARRAARSGAGRRWERTDLFEGRLGGAGAWVFHRTFSALARPYFMICALVRFDPAPWSPESALDALGDLLSLGLVHHVGRYEPILPGNRGVQDLTLDPRLVVGESRAMKEVLARLRAAVDTGVHVLLRGEAGSGRELLARSIHLSSPRRNGPFIVTTTAGANPVQLEADLFGSEVVGRSAPVKREGRLRLADGGTLYLDSVDRLPLDLQARLVRFLRSGEVEPAGSREVHRVDVRLVAASLRPLEPAVARDEVRVDLAYRLSRFVIDVPALRERKEDLPLLIQSFINRFCHDTGKRVAGITTKAMTALLAYSYPGNLEELENIARQMVYLCPHGQPVDVSLLPDPVRASPLQATARVEATSDLDLDRLVAGAEEAAIREALRRTLGNKSQAAKLLGISRNTLAAKMEKYEVAG